MAKFLDFRLLRLNINYFRKTLASFLSFLLIYMSLAPSLAQAQVAPRGPGQKLENKESSGFYNPHNLRQRILKQQAVVREMRRRDQRQDRQKLKNLRDVFQNIQSVLKATFQNKEEFEAEVERRRKASAAIFGEGGLFSYVKYPDGKKVWFKGGQVAKVENEQVKDAHGNVSIRNMYDMEYDSKGLLVSYRSDVTDSFGHKESIYWHGATYSDDSVAYGGEGTDYKKLLTSYTEERTDDQGNTTKVQWSGATYNENDQLTSYKQISTDANGNKSTKSWKNGQYDDQNRLIGYTEENIDALGNKTTRNWSGGTYERNPSYISPEETPWHQQYLLTGFEEEIIDAQGNKTKRTWSDGTYNEFGELVSYNETTTKFISGEELTETLSWLNGEYDNHGRLVSYMQSQTDSQGNTTDTIWEQGNYDDRGRLIFYQETQIDPNANQTRKTWEAAADGYDNKNRLVHYNETNVDARGNSSKRSWKALAFDQYNRVLKTNESFTDPNGITKSKVWETTSAGYNQFGQLQSYHETWTDSFGYVTEVDWEGAEYDQWGNLVSYFETTTDINGNQSTREWIDGQYDAQGRVLSYTEKRTDINGNTEITAWSGAVYGSLGQLLRYTEQLTNWFGETQTKAWQTTEDNYNSLGDLIGFTETITGFDGSIIQRERSASRYNHLGQLVHYEEHTRQTSPLTSIDPETGQEYQLDDADITELTQTEPIETFKVWTNGEYDVYGRLTNYLETDRDSQGQEQSKEWSGEYNRKGYLDSYSETLKTIQGTTLTTDWEAFAFDNQGRVTSSRQYQTNSKEPYVSVRTDVENRKYDAHGQTSGGIEVIVTSGSSIDGHSVFIKEERSISNATFDSGVLTGYVEDITTTGTDFNLTWIETHQQRTLSNMSRTGYSETTTTFYPEDPSLTHTVQVNRTDIQRDMNGRVVSYIDEIFDQTTGPTPTRVQRLLTQFGSFNQINLFADIIDSPNGDRELKITTDIVQDDQGRMTQFEETSRKHKSGAQSLPDNWNLLSQKEKREFLDQIREFLPEGATLTLQPKKGQVKISLFVIETRNRVSSTYDALGRLIHSIDHRSSTEQTGVDVVEWTAHRFNEANQIASDTTTTNNFDEGSLTGDPNWTTESIRSSIHYNHLGQISSYREKATDSRKPDEKIFREVSGITYDSFGKIATSVDRTLTEQYEDQTQTTLLQSRTTEITRTDAQFDAEGRLTGFREVTHSFGTSENGDRLNHTQVRVRSGIRYDSDNKDQILGYTDHITESSSPGVLTTVERQNQTFGLNDEVTEYTETITQQGESVERLPDNTLVHLPYSLTETIHRTGIVIDDQGLLLSYFEERTSSATPDETHRIQWSATYDEQDRLSSSTEVTTIVVDGQVVEVKTSIRSQITYNDLDLMASYHDETSTRVVLEDGSFSEALIQTNHRTGIEYNTLQQLVGYNETLTRSDSNLIEEKVFERGRYDFAGRLKSFRETTRSHGVDADGNFFDVTTVVTRIESHYNGLGLLAGYKQTRTSSDAPNLIITDTTSNTLYDEQGRELSFIRSEHHQSVPGSDEIINLRVTTTRTNAGYDGRGRTASYQDDVRRLNSMIDVTESTRVDNQTYNAWGQIDSYERWETSSSFPDKNIYTQYQVTEIDSQGRPRSYREIVQTGESIQENVRNNIQYDFFGQIMSYDETQTNRPNGEEKLIHWQGEYNEMGQLVSFLETTEIDELDTNTHREDITYNSLGQMISYNETGYSSATPDATTNTSWVGGYNSAGLLRSYTQSTITTGPGLNTTDRITRDNITYLRNGLAKGYLETRWSSASPDLTVTLQRKRTSYDGWGRENTFLEIETHSSPDGSLNLSIQRERTQTVYNDRGQIIYRTDKERSSASPLVTDHISWSATYDDQNRIASYIETRRQLGRDLYGRELDRTTVRNIEAREYDEFGRLVFEQSSIHQEGQAPQHRIWEALAINGLGQVTQERETNSQTGEVLDTETQTNRTNIQYDIFGRQIGFQESIWNSSEPDKQTERLVTGRSFNSLGQLISEVIDTNQYDIETGGENYFNNETLVQTGMEYDSQGRLIGATNTHTDHEEGIQTIEILSGVEFNAFGIQIRSRKEIQKTSLTEGLLESYSTIDNHTMNFNTLGQPTRVHETTWNSSAPDLINTTLTSFMTYNKDGQLETFTKRSVSQHMTDPSIHRVVNDQIRHSTQYNAAGQVTRINDLIIRNSAPLIRDNVIETMEYNGLGQVIGQERQTHTTSSDGHINITQHQTIRSSYNSIGQLEEQTVVGHSSQYPGITVTETTRFVYGEAGLIDDQITSSSRQGQGPPMTQEEVDALLQTPEFQELEEAQRDALTQALLNGQEINIQETRHQTDIEHDQEGRAVSYTETISTSDRPEILTTVTRKSTGYNSLGQLFDFEEEVREQSLSEDDLYDVITTRTRHETTYDARGRLYSYREQSQKGDEPTKYNTRHRTEYNHYGYVLSQRDSTETKILGEVITHVSVTQRNNRYDSQGRLISFQENTYSLLDGESTRIWQALAFGVNGEPIRTRESGHSDQQGSWERSTEQFGLDSSGRPLLVHSHGTSATEGSHDTWTTQIDPDGIIGINAMGQSTYQIEFGFRHGQSNFVRITESGFDDSYDELGRAQHSVVTLIQDGVVTITEVLSQEYNERGQVMAKDYSVTKIFENGESETTVHRWEGNHNYLGQLESFTETGTRQIFDAEGNLVGIESSLNAQSDIQYNDKGQVVSFDQTTSQVIVDADGNLIKENHTEFERENIQYNDEGQVVYYEEEGSRDGSKYVETYQAFSFDENGQPIDWTREGTNDTTGPYTLNQENSEYNDLGQLVSYVQSGVQSGQPFTKSVANSRYNSRGQLVSSDESGETDAGLYEFSLELSYDQFGRVNQRIENGTGPEGNYSLVSDQFTYDTKGRVLSRHSVKTDSHGEVHHINWTADQGYDEFGRLISHVQTDRTVDADRNFVSETVTQYTAMSHFNNNLIESYQNVITKTNADGSIEVTEHTHTNLSVHEEGWFNGTRDETNKTVTTADGEVTQTSSTVQKDNITRYTQADAAKNPEHRAGRISGYQETVVKNDETPIYSQVGNITYDSEGNEHLSDRASVTRNALLETWDQVVALGEKVFQALADLFSTLIEIISTPGSSLESLLPDEKLTPIEGEVKTKTPTAINILNPDDFTIDVVQRINGQKDEHGRVRSWTEITQSSKAPAKKTISEVSVTYSGSSNELDTYDATVTSSIDGYTHTSVIHQEGYEYEAGRVVRVQGTIQESWQNNRTFEVEMERSYDFEDIHHAFDELGRITKTERLTTNDTTSPDLVKRDQSEMTYDELGRVATRRTTTEEYANPENTDEAYFKTSTSSDEYIYDSAGRLVQTVRTTTDSNAPNQTITQTIDHSDFDSYGRATHLEINKVTDNGETITTDQIVEDIKAFSAHGQAMTVVRTTIHTQGDTRTETSQSVTNSYDELGRLDKSISQNSQTGTAVIDGAIETMNRQWEEIIENKAYDRFGRVSQMVRTTNNDSDKPTMEQRKEFVEMSYDELGRVNHRNAWVQENLVTGRQRRYQQTTDIEEFDELGRPLTFTKVTLNDTLAPDKKIIETTLKAEYDERGHMIRSRSITAEEGVNDDGTSYQTEPQEVTRDFTYDNFGRMKNQSELNHTLIQNINDQIPVTQAEIEALQQELATLTGDELEAKTELLAVLEADLNQLQDQLATYSREGMTSQTRGMIYDQENQLIGATVVDVATGEETEQTDFSYDEFGMRQSYTETDSHTGNSRVINLSYDAYFRVVATQVNHSDYPLIDQNQIGTPHTYTTIDQTDRFDSNGRALLTTSIRLNDSAELDKVSTTQTRLRYDEKGRVNSRESRNRTTGTVASTGATDPENPIEAEEGAIGIGEPSLYETTSTNLLVVTEFDLIGRTKSFVQTSRSSTAPAKQIITEGRYLYGEKGQMAGTDARVTERGVGLNTSRHEIALTTKFSETGLALRTLRFVDQDASAPDKTTLTKDNEDLEYNHLGQVTRRSNTTQESGPGLDKSSTLVETYAYNQYGDVTTINREATSTDRPDQTVVTTIENRAWDNQGRVVKSKISNTTTTIADDIYDIAHDWLWQSIHAFDANGQSRLLTTWSLEDDGEMDYWVKKNTKQSYDIHGRLYRSESNVQEHKKSKEEVWVPIYENDIDTGEKELKFLTEVRSYNETKVFLEYNRLGLAAKINTRTTNDTKTGMQATTNLQSLKYDSLGRVIDNLNETTTLNAKGYRRSYTTRTQTTKFDEWGNPVDFTTTTSNDSEAPDKVLVEKTTDAKYENSRIVDANVTLTESGGREEDGSTYSETNVYKRAWSYNAIGQMDGFWELNETQFENFQKDLETVGVELIDLSQQIADLKTRQDEIPERMATLVDDLNLLEQQAKAPILSELDQLRSEEAQWGEINHMVDTLRGEIPATEQELATMERALKEYLIEIGEVTDTGQPGSSETTGLSPPINPDRVDHFKNLFRIAVGDLNQNDFNVNFGGTARYRYLEIINRKYDGGGQYNHSGHWMHKQTKLAIFSERRDSIKIRLRTITDDFKNRRAEGRRDLQKESDDISLEITALEEAIVTKKDFQAHLKETIATIEETGWTSTQTGIVYNEDGQVIGQVVWNAETNEDVVQTGHQYDEHGTLLSYKQTHPSSEVGQTDTITMTYDSLGRLDSTKTETIKILDGETYKETSSQKVLARDSSGRVTQLEITSSNSEEERTNVNVVSMTYDEKNRVKSRHTERYKKKKDGTRLFLGENTTIGKTFYASGQVKDYATTSREATSPDLVTTDVGTYIYGKKGKLVGSIKTITEKGSTLDKSRKVIEIATEHDKLGRVIGQLRLTTDDTSKPESSILDEISIEYAGVSKNSKTTTLRMETAANRELHHVRITTVTEVDEQGRPKSVVTTTDNDVYGQDFERDEEGNIISYKEVGDGTITVRHRPNLKKGTRVEKWDIQYNELDQEISYKEKTTDNASSDAPTEVDRFNLTYNGDGLLHSFVETNKDVRRDVTSTSYDSQGRVIRQEENRTWGIDTYELEYYQVEVGKGMFKRKRTLSRPKRTDWGTEGGNIPGLSNEWTHGNVRMVQTYSYDAHGNITGHNIDVKGTGTNPSLLPFAVAGTGGTRGLGVNGDLTFSSSRSNMKYDAKGRIVSYSQTVLQYQLTFENYLSSSKRFGRGRKTKTRQVVGLVQTTTNEKNLDFNEFGQVTKSESTYYNSLGGHGWTNRENITYDSHGRMASATTESYSVTPFKADGKGHVSFVHSKKDQTFSYDENGKATTHDVHTHFHDERVESPKSGNFFASDLGQLTKIAISVAISVMVPGGGTFAAGLIYGAIAGAVSVAINAAVMYHMGASPKEIWKASAVTFAASIITAGAPTNLDQAGFLIAKRFVLQKASEKIAEKSGSTSAAFWTTLASAITTKDFSAGVKASFTRAMLGTLRRAGTSAVAREIVRKNEGPKGEQSWLLAMLDGTGILEGTLDLTATNLIQSKVETQKFENKKKEILNKDSKGHGRWNNKKPNETMFGKILGFAQSLINTLQLSDKDSLIASSTKNSDQNIDEKKSKFGSENAAVLPREYAEEQEFQKTQNMTTKNQDLNLSLGNPQKESISEEQARNGDLEEFKENRENNVNSQETIDQSMTSKVSELLRLQAGDLSDENITAAFNEFGENIEISHEKGQIKKVEISGNAFGLKTTIHFDSMKTDVDGNVVLASGRIERETPLGVIKTDWQFAAKGTAEFEKAISSILSKGGDATQEIKGALTGASSVFTETTENGETRRVFLGENGTPVLSEHKNSKGEYSLYTYKKEESTGLVTGSIYKRNEKTNYELAGTFEQGGAENSLVLKTKESLTNLYVNTKNKEALQSALINVSRTHIEKDLNQNIQKEIGLTKDGQVAYVLDLSKNNLTVMTGNNPRQFYATQEGDQLFLVASKEVVQQQDVQDLTMALPVTGENDVAVTTNKLVETQSNVNKELAQSSIQEAKEKAKTQQKGLAEEIKKQTGKKISVKEVLKEQFGGLISLITAPFKIVAGLISAVIAQASIIIEAFKEVQELKTQREAVSLELPGKIVTTKGKVFTEQQLEQEEQILKENISTHFQKKTKLHNQIKQLNSQAVVELNRSHQASGEALFEYDGGDIESRIKSDQIRESVYQSRFEKLAELKTKGDLTSYFALLKTTQKQFSQEKALTNQLTLDLAAAKKPLTLLQHSYANITRVKQEAKDLDNKIPFESIKLMRVSFKGLVDAQKELKHNSAIGFSLNSLIETIEAEAKEVASAKPAIEKMIEEGMRTNPIGMVILLTRMIEFDASKPNASFLQKQLAAINVSKFVEEGYEMLLNSDGKPSDYAKLWLGLTLSAATELFGSAANLAQRSFGQAAEDGTAAFLTKMGASEETKEVWVGRARKLAETTGLAAAVSKPTKLFQKETWKKFALSFGLISGTQASLDKTADAVVDTFGGTDYHKKILLNAVGVGAAGTGLRAKNKLAKATTQVKKQQNILTRAKNFETKLNLEFSKLTGELQSIKNQKIYYKNQIADLKKAQSLKGAINERGPAIQRIKTRLGRAGETARRTESFRSEVQRTRSKIQTFRSKLRDLTTREQGKYQRLQNLVETSRRVGKIKRQIHGNIKLSQKLINKYEPIKKAASFVAGEIKKSAFALRKPLQEQQKFNWRDALSFSLSPAFPIMNPMLR